jgi:hypothetical protein
MCSSKRPSVWGRLYGSPKHLYIVYFHKAVTMNHLSCLDTKLDLVCGFRNLLAPLPFHSFNTPLTAAQFCPENCCQSLMDSDCSLDIQILLQQIQVRVQLNQSTLIFTILIFHFYPSDVCVCVCFLPVVADPSIKI